MPVSSTKSGANTRSSHSSVRDPAVVRSLDQKSLMALMSKLQITVLPPESNHQTFEEIIGHDEEKNFLQQIIKFTKDPEQLKSLPSSFTVYQRFILMGLKGIGKSMLVAAFANAIHLPLLTVDLTKFMDNTHSLLATMNSFESVLKYYPQSVICLKGLHNLDVLEDKITFPFYSRLSDYMRTYSGIFFFAVSDIMFQLPAFLLESNTGFQTIFQLDSPDLIQREALLKRYITPYPHVENLDFNKIARNTLGMTAGMMVHMLNNAYQHCCMKGKKDLDYEAIDYTITKQFFGQEQKRMTEEMRTLIAYHEAGHVIAGYFSDPKHYKLSKVEIAQRAESLGFTAHEEDEEKLLYFRSDIENSVITNFGGIVAERIIYGQNSSGVVQDLSNATLLVDSMIKKYGMCDEFGPISLMNDVVDEEGNSEGYGILSNDLSSIADGYLRDWLKRLYAKCQTILTEHREELEALASTLLEKETVYSDEMLAIFQKIAKKRAKKKH